MKNRQPISYLLPDMLAHTCNPITWEAETKGLTVQGQPGVHSKFQANLDYRNLLSKKKQAKQ
jgi:hypothetical protein